MDDTFLPRLWSDLGGDAALLDTVAITGSGPLPSVYDVEGFAASAVAAANLAVAELWAQRRGGPLPSVTVDRRAASAAFSCERLLRAEGWELPPVWDPIAGDYPTADGWIRLHTNYSYHRDAVTAVLDVPADRAAVAAAVRRWSGDDLESAVVAAGGCAAVMRTTAEWHTHPAGAATAGEPAVTVTRAEHDGALPPPGDRPLSGIRVLDLTRVIAGPVATRYLAAHGADVVRIDPPGFEEVGLLLPETTRGKRCAALDLRVDGDRAVFEHLAGEAHVLVDGYRADALARLGYDTAALAALNPGLVVVSHDAYGWSGPWAGRRGFDSLVQMSTGIAAAGAAATGATQPVPLPVQALDHGTGFLLAAGACRALTEVARTGRTHHVRGSLVGAANVLSSAPSADGPAARPTAWTDDDTAPAVTAWGPVRQVPVPAGVDGHPPRLDPDRTAGPVGVVRPAGW